MASKLLVALCLLQVVIMNAQLPYLEPEVEQLLRNLTRPADLDHCEQTVCYPPCPGAMPPRRCPTDVPACHSGCACYTDCKRAIITCFETKDCVHTRQFTARRRATTTVRY